MNKNVVTKITLISLIAILLCVYLVQIASTGKSKVRNLVLSESPDKITIVQGSDEASSVLINVAKGKSTVGKNTSGSIMYPANEATVSSLVELLQNIKLLGTVASGVNANTADRYGLDDNSKITVTACKDGKVLRTIVVGKNTATGTQCYMQADSKQTVYLEDKPLHTSFAVTVDSLRSKEAYTFSDSDVIHVKLANSSGSVDFAKQIPQASMTDESASKITWAVAENTTGAEGTLDESSFTSWLKSVSSLNVSEWAADTAVLPQGEPGSELTFTLPGRTVTIALYPLEDDEDKRVLCSCSATPYRFYLSESTSKKFLKSAGDFIK